MDASEMMKLRTGDSATGAARIMRALERSNANNLMIKLPSDSEAAIENIQKFTNAANVNLLDAIVDGKSRAARGHVPISGAGRNYFSLAGHTDARLGSGGQIGRASCRERGCQYVSISVVAGSLQIK